MAERIVSLMLDEGVYQTTKDYCYNKKLKLKHFIREAIIEALFSRGIKKSKDKK
jgi:hypothetical protein